MSKNKKSKVLQSVKDNYQYFVAVPLFKAANAAESGLRIEAEQAEGVPNRDIFTIMKDFIKYALYAIGLLGVIMFIVAGFQYLTAAGDDTKIATAKRSMTYAIVGLGVAILGLVAIRIVDMIIAGSAA